MDREVEKKLDKLVDSYFEDFLKSLEKLIEIPSKMGKAEDGYPFGKEPAKALEIALEISKNLGFETLNVDNYAGHAVYGNKNGKNYAVLGHLDVVPEGEGWDTDPFKLVIKDGFMYGRGVSDDKGPTLGALYALKAASELVKEPNNNVKIIFGTNEENGSECLKYYFTKQPYPDAAVTPDADFPLIYAEKGIANYGFTVDIPETNYHTKLVAFEGGTASNVVIEKCHAVIETEKVKEIEYILKNYRPNGKVEWEIEGNRITIKAFGKPAHGSRPQDGLNAAWDILAILSLIDLGELNTAIRTAYDKLGKDYNGTALGVDSADISGRLTCNLGVVKLENGKLNFVINIRYPIFVNIEMLTRQITEAMKGFQTKLLSNTKPLYVSKDSDLVQTLLKVYRDVTKDDHEPFAIGGGTYARQVPYGVAFGAAFPGEETNIHQAGEKWNIENAKKFIKIYARLMYKWLTE